MKRNKMMVEEITEEYGEFVASTLNAKKDYLVSLRTEGKSVNLQEEVIIVCLLPVMK